MSDRERDGLIEAVEEHYSDRAEQLEKLRENKAVGMLLEWATNGEWWEGSFSYSGIFTPMHVIDGD